MPREIPSALAFALAALCPPVISRAGEAITAARSEKRGAPVWAKIADMTTDSDQIDQGAVVDDQLVVRRVIPAPIDKVFDALADSATHEAIDGTGWVRQPTGDAAITAAGQIFEMDMFHDAAGGDYRMRNEVIRCQRPTAIGWLPIGQGPDGTWAPGGWTWSYSLAPASGGTEVTLTYDWSAVPDFLRRHIPFPPFPVSHLENSLANLEQIVVRS